MVAGETISRGELLPDEDAARLVFARLEQSDAAGGVVLDGFPRTLAQVHLLDDWLRARGRQVPVALFIDVPSSELLARLHHRGTVSDRTDDRADVAQHRLEIFGGELRAVLDDYERRGILRRIDGLGSPEAVHRRVLRVLMLNIPQFCRTLSS